MVVGVLVEQLQVANAELATLALTDSLTGLANRRAILNDVARLLVQALREHFNDHWQGRVVALESTSALLSRAASNVLRFKTDATLPSDLAAQARITGRVVQLPALDALAVEHILARLREVGVTPEDIEIRKADLEDVFLDLTGSGALPLSPPATAEVTG